AAQASSQDTLLALGADATLYLVMSNGMLYVLGAEIDAYEVSGSIAQVENGVVVTLRGTLEQTVEAGSEGKFVFPRVLPGEYLVYPFKDGCQFDPPSMLVRVNRSDQSDIVFSGTVVGPEIIAAKAVPGRIPNDGSKEVLITVEMNPDSYSQLTVQVDLSSLGGSEQQALYDDGSRGDLDAGDGIFSCRTAIGSDIALGQQGLEVVASDPQGKSAHDFIVIEVVSEISGSISASYEVEIDRAGQRLSIEYSLSSIVSLAPATRDMVLGQCEGGARTDNGSQVDEAEFYLEVFPPGTDTPIFETGISAELTQFEVEDAPAGTWVYKITKKGGVVRMAGRQTAASFQYSVATATAGSGMVFGMVIDADSGARLDGVALSTSIGGTALTVDGYYLLLSPAGMLSLSVAGSQHLPVVKSINLVSGDSVEANIFLTVQETSGGGGDEPGGSDCPLDALSGVNNRQFNLLRTFRDETLAKSLYGRMLIKQYYQFAPILKDVLLREPALREGFEHVLQGLMAGLEVVAKRGPER
ncbi:MAG: hypothetical protein GY868_10220, partial [Deltaproteobacteria bacterium]|nr:hypothetical protein [Deltaproteobacteria bacterium]